MTKRYWTKSTESYEWILRNFMERTDYTYHHTDLGMLDIDFDYLPEDERLDAAAETILSEHPEEVEKAYAERMALLLDGFFNMPADGRYKGRANEGKVTDLSEKEDFNAVFVNADKLMAKDFIEKGGHAWDGILDGYPLRFIKNENGSISLTQLLSNSEHRRIYKAYIRRSVTDLEDGNGERTKRLFAARLFMLCHSAVEILIAEEEVPVGERDDRQV